MTATPACLALLERLSAYLDEEVDPETCQEIEDHCRACPECAALVGGLRDTIGLCRATGERPLPGPVREKARAQIARLLDRSNEPD